VSVASLSTSFFSEHHFFTLLNHPYVFYVATKSQEEHLAVKHHAPIKTNMDNLVIFMNNDIIYYCNFPVQYFAYEISLWKIIFSEFTQLPEFNLFEVPNYLV